jgi:anti-sigma factor RsiW
VETDMNIDLEGDACDSEAARLLPWFVNGRLSAADGARVTQHLAHCRICSTDLEQQRSIRSLLKADGPVEFGPQPGLARTLARIDEVEREMTPAGAMARRARGGRRRFGSSQWLAAAVIVQAIGLGVLGAAYLGRPSSDRTEARYATLSAPAVPAGGRRIRVVFAGSMSISEIRELLAAQQLQVVAGPSEAGVFTLGVVSSAPQADRLEKSLLVLRRNPRVLFAEPASSDGVPSR